MSAPRGYTEVERRAARVASSRRYRERHPEQVKAKNQAIYRRNPEREKDRVRGTRYGMAPGEYDRFVKVQHGLCAACHELPDKKGLCVDHCHESGLVRGLLCHACNTALGLLRECPQRMNALKEYISNFTWLK